MGKTKFGFYAVARGHVVGIFNTWDDCKAQVNGFPNARYKKFPTRNEANDFIAENKGQGPATGLGGISKKVVTAAGVINKFPKSSTVFVHEPSTSNAPVPFFKQLTPHAPAWKKNYRHDIHNNNTGATTLVQPKRGISISATTSLAEFRKKLRVTEDRLVSNKSSKHEDGHISFNSGADLSNFSVDEDGFVIVYTDGACQANGKFGAKAGVGIWFGENHDLNVSEPVIGRQTNNTAEIQAAEISVSQAKKAGIDKLCIKTDSQFVINCVTKWVNKWMKNGWKLGDGQPVKNKEDLEKLMAVMKGVDVKWSYVKAHKGIHGNEEADRLAVEGARKR